MQVESHKSFGENNDTHHRGRHPCPWATAWDGATVGCLPAPAARRRHGCFAVAALLVMTGLYLFDAHARGAPS